MLEFLLHLLQLVALLFHSVPGVKEFCTEQVKNDSHHNLGVKFRNKLRHHHSECAADDGHQNQREARSAPDGDSIILHRHDGGKEKSLVIGKSNLVTDFGYNHGSKCLSENS